MKSVEILFFGSETARGDETLLASFHGAAAIGMRAVATNDYRGQCDWLCIHGASQVKRRPARAAHINRGRYVACWDHGYFQRAGYMRVSINKLHPQGWIGKTPPDPSRLDARGIKLLDGYYNPTGHIVIIGVGGKKRMKNLDNEWELAQIEEMRLRFPERKIVYRPKPGLGITEAIGADACDNSESIFDVYKGASLVVCAHSSAAIDACIAGIPVECTDGAAFWLYDKNPYPTPEERLDFLRRVAWWNWRLDEIEQGLAWKFLLQVTR